MNNKLPAWVLILLQLLLTGAVLCIFALFHHVIPRIRLQTEGLPEPIATAAPVQPSASAEDPIPQNWRERFADRFSDSVEWTDNSYRSPDLAVTVTEYAQPEDFPNQSYFVADIYLTDAEQFCALLSPPGRTFSPPVTLARQGNPVIAVNGDCFPAQKKSFVIRNGELYRNDPTDADVCVLYRDGRIEILGPGEYDADRLLAGGAWQVWHFGPSLLDGEGRPLEEFNIPAEIQWENPRTVLGYYEPGHYCFAVVDGRQGQSAEGADMPTLARLMAGLGCSAAYNLDGGASSVMIFHGEIINRPFKDRNISDLLSITELEEGEG